MFIEVLSDDGRREGPSIPPWINAWVDLDYQPSLWLRSWWSLHDVERPRIPDSRDPSKTIRNGIGVATPRSDNDYDIALDFMAVWLTLHLHELLEWVKVDGEPLACAHPETLPRELIPDKTRDGKPRIWGYWDWTIAKMRKVIEQYCKRYPRSS